MEAKRFKASLVIKGFQQVEGVDFGDTFAPVAKLVGFHMLIALSALYGRFIDHMDVVSAFLNPPIDEKIYMLLPEGAEWTQKLPRSETGVICKLRKALYGLKQAPRLWFKHIDALFRKNSFTQYPNEPTLYILHGRSRNTGNAGRA
jgi:hypothetical protein